MLYKSCIYVVNLFVSYLKLTTKMAQNSPKNWSYLIGFGLFQYKKKDLKMILKNVDCFWPNEWVCRPKLAPLASH